MKLIMSETTMRKLYGVGVGVIKNKQVYMCRRGDSIQPFGKKWQFIHGALLAGEQSMQAACRLVEEQMGIKGITKDRLSFGTYVDEYKDEFYYVYLINLKPDEIPMNTDSNKRGDWRLFSLDKAIPLDVLPGLRTILISLNRTLEKWEGIRKVIKFSKIQDQMTPGEKLHMSHASCPLGPKMTRLRLVT
jgi:8-oxo-dGTP pyrophosphatase MutT (NUDIX family)